MGELSGTSLAALAIGAIWILIAAIIAVLAARRLRAADAAIRSARGLSVLLELAPARPLVVRPDGRLEIDARLLRELGVDGKPDGLAALSGDGWGFDADDLKALTAAV